jgi:hypothetical protein
MKPTLIPTNLGIMTETVRQAGTELYLPRFSFVVLTEPTNQPESTRVKQYFARPIGAMWVPFGREDDPHAEYENRLVKRNPEDSILIHYTECIPITDCQMLAFTQVCERYEELPLTIWPEICNPTTLMLQFKSIVIGIEPDGHAHS